MFSTNLGGVILGAIIILSTAGCAKAPNPQRAAFSQCRLEAFHKIGADQNNDPRGFAMGQYVAPCMEAHGYTWSVGNSGCNVVADFGALNRDVNLDPACYVPTEKMIK